jgi:DNA-binding transcriptional LysR family regulator
VSNALGRLRGLLGDPLVVRRPYGLAPTPRAAALAPRLRALLREARELISGGDAPAVEDTTRWVSVACTDALAVVLIGPLLAGLGESMPGARLRMVTLDRMVAGDGLARGDVDALVGVPPSIPPGCTSERLFDDPLRVIVRADHPRVGKRLSLATYAALPHAEIALFGEPDEAVDRALARHGRTRNVRVAVPHFASLPIAVTESDALATLSGRVAEGFARHYPLRVLRPPVALPDLTISLVWHRRSERDAVATELRRLLHECVRRR